MALNLSNATASKQPKKKFELIQRQDHSERNHADRISDLEFSERLFKTLDARVLIVGLGGLGSPAAMYLAAGGVGTLVLSDYDRVEASNLQRQIIHRESDIGELKAASAKKSLNEFLAL